MSRRRAPTRARAAPRSRPASRRPSRHPPSRSRVEVDDGGRPGRILRELGVARRLGQQPLGEGADPGLVPEEQHAVDVRRPPQHREHGLRAGVVELGQVARLGRRRPRRRSPTRSPASAARSRPAPGPAGSRLRFIQAPTSAGAAPPALVERPVEVALARVGPARLGVAHQDQASHHDLPAMKVAPCGRPDCASGRSSAPTGQARRTAQPRSRQSRPGALSRKPWQAATS